MAAQHKRKGAAARLARIERATERAEMIESRKKINKQRQEEAILRLLKMNGW